MSISSRPVIAITNPYIWPHVRRGSERLLNDLSHYLANRNYPVEVYSMAPENRCWQQGNIQYTTIKQKWSTRFRQWNDCHYFAFKLISRLRDTRASVVHCLNYFDAYAAIVARKRYRLNYKICFHAVGIPTARYFRAVPLDYWFMQSTIKHCDVIFALSQFAKHKIESDFQIKAHILPPPVNRPDDHLLEIPKTQENIPTLLFVGDLLEPRKGAMLLLKAFVQLIQEYPAARLIFSGRVNDHFIKQAMEIEGVHAIRNSIIFKGIGEISDLPELYRLASITVLPSVWEAFGLVLIESLSMGTPVVGTRHAGITDIINTNQVGRLFEPGEFDINTDNLQGLLQSIRECIELSRNPETAVHCINRADDFSWQNLGPKYEDHYLQLLENDS